MSFWFYKKNKSGQRHLYSVNIAFPVILIIISLLVAVFTRCYIKRNDQAVIEIKEKICYIADEQTKNLRIPEMTLSKMLNAIEDKRISTQNKAIIIQRLAIFPGKQTIEALIPILDDENKVMKDHYTAEKEGGTWALSEVSLGTVALETINKITGNNFSGPGEAIDWHTRYPD